jgi:tRNA A-37 threonylcarbamoyl transferase component Bud32
VRPDLGEWFEVQQDGYRLRHRRLFSPPFALRAVARHRENAAQRERACEHWGPGSSVSRVAIAGPLGPLDLAVKWNHPRGLRRAVAETLRGSRAVRAVVGAARVRAAGLRPPEILAVVERRRRGCVQESFLIARFAADALPLPALAPALRADRRRRRALARSLGDAIGRLHAAGLDHRDLKHSNLMVGDGDGLILLDLEAVEAPRAVGLRRRVRALGQLEAYAADLYPWLPRTDRLRFLRAYLVHAPGLAPRRRELAERIEAWAGRRLAEWACRSRPDRDRFPLAPRTPGPG